MGAHVLAKPLQAAPSGPSINGKRSPPAMVACAPAALGPPGQTMTPSDKWPVPSYGELLFSVR